jgi:TetR/AcrR family transcriptional regulator, cholesterol catabolism regulator
VTLGSRTVGGPRQRRDYVESATARRNILDGAAALFTQRGFHATTVREIGDHVGIGQSSLYYHAKNKSQILVDINEEFMDGLVAAMDEVASGPGSGLDKLDLVVHALLREIAEHRDIVSVVLHEHRSLPEPATVGIREKRDHVDAVIDGILRSGIADGSIRPGSVRLTRLAITGMTSWASTWLDPAGSPSADEIARAFLDLLHHGVAGPDAR